MGKMEDLKWVRVFTPYHIPKKLVEQIKKRDYEVDDFFRYHEKTALRYTKEGPTLNPYSHLYVLADENHLVKGFVWFVIDPLTKDLVINTYSVDAEYWKSGDAVPKLIEFIKEIHSKGNLKKIYWITDYENHSKKYGFKKSKSVLMEYSEENNGKNTLGRDKSGRVNRSSKSSATTILDESTGDSDGSSPDSVRGSS